jgi:crotonobetainyl-CoA:carnitine CoA-transferase CaiB-like acyl-CoA transferase
MAIDSGPILHDVRVLDASRVLAGPLCGQILADLGAQVVKIERPGTGDETRAWGPPFLGGTSAYYLSCNRNKRSVAIDLGKAHGVRLLHELARKSDVLLENFLPESARKLGLDPQQLLKINPRLVICSLSGFGRTGPRRDQPGYDFAIQALSGLMDITGPPAGPPCKVGVAVVDVLTGLYASTAVLACLHARNQTNHGYVIDLALLDCAVASQVNVLQAYLSSRQPAARVGNAHLQIVPYQLLQTRDGWLVLAVGNDGQWQRFCSAVGLDDLAREERFRANADRVRHRMELLPLLEAHLRTRTTAQWETCLLAADVPHAPVWDYSTLLADPQAAARGLRMTVTDAKGEPVELIGSPFHIEGAPRAEPRCPPGLGADTESVLRELLGLDAARIAELRADGIVEGPDRVLR